MSTEPWYQRPLRKPMSRTHVPPQPWRTLSHAIAYNRHIQVIEDLVGTPDGDEFVYV